MAPVIQQRKPVSSRAWEALTPPLSEWILDAVASMGFQQLTPVQASTIPLFIGNKDVVVEAVTGSGKTLAFLIPVIERLLRLEEPIKKHHVGAIVVSPTRELAAQIYGVLMSLLSFHPPSAAALGHLNISEEQFTFESSAPPIPLSSVSRIIPQLLLGDGKTSPAEDLRIFLKQSSNLLVATPGRLAAMLSSPYVHCPQSSFEVLVLDEADRLLDLGFKEDLQRILSRLPKQRRTGLFSASVTEAVDQIIRVGLRNPVKIAVKVKGLSGIDDKRTPASLRMTYLVTPPTHKFPTLERLLTQVGSVPQKSIVYFSTCAQVDYFQHLVRPLLSRDFKVVPLHGKYPPKVREKNFKLFSTSAVNSVLLTTDVAARGLDIPTVDLVVQIDPPSDPKVFLHRCGRAGRAGRKGLSVVFLHPGREEDYVPFLSVRKTPITKLEEESLRISAEDVKKYTTSFVDVVSQDRDLHDKGQRAFVSWVKSYTKHQASSIFPVKDLDWYELGKAWGLLKLPKMPEMKAFTGDKNLGLDINLDEITYRDQQREKRRLEDLQGDREHVHKEQRRDGGKKTSAWSDKVEQKEERERRRTKRSKRRESERVSKLTEEEKLRERETDKMVEEIRKQNDGSAKSIHVDDDEFIGFGD